MTYIGTITDCQISRFRKRSFKGETRYFAEIVWLGGWVEVPLLDESLLNVLPVGVWGAAIVDQGFYKTVKEVKKENNVYSFPAFDPVINFLSDFKPNK